MSSSGKGLLRYNFPYEKSVILHMKKLERTFFTLECFVLSLIDTEPLVREKKNFKVFALYGYRLPLEMGVVLHLNKVDTRPASSDSSRPLNVKQYTRLD